jgi:hypothetical protein
LARIAFQTGRIGVDGLGHAHDAAALAASPL